MTGTIYIASHKAGPAGIVGFQHLYLVYDPNNQPNSHPQTDTGVQIIRGGPGDSAVNGWGNILVEAGILLSSQPNDSFSYDWNNNGQPDTPSERNFTTLNLNGQDAAVVWSRMVTFANTLQNAMFDYDIFSTFMSTSNSIVTTVLSRENIDIATVTPILSGDGSGNQRIPQSQFPGSSTFLSGSGSDALQGFNGPDVFHDKGGGSDTFYGGVSSNKVLYDNTDGHDAVFYENAGPVVPVHAKIYPDHMTVTDGEGGTDTLYSIEEINAKNATTSAWLDYAAYGQGIKVQDLSQAEIQGAASAFGNDVAYASSITQGLNTFIANNFGMITGTSYADTFLLNNTLGRTFDGGAGSDTVIIDANTSLAMGNGFLISNSLSSYNGAPVLKNIETVDMAVGRAGYFIVDTLGHAFSNRVATLNYQAHAGSLRIDATSSVTVTDGSGRSDTLGDGGTIVGSNSGDTIYMTPNAHTLMMTGAGNDIIYNNNPSWDYTPAYVYGGGRYVQKFLLNLSATTYACYD